MLFYTPSFLPYGGGGSTVVRRPFPSISVTGTSCSLMCEHCGGKLLNTMIPVSSPSELLETCKRISKEGGAGCLVSGGSSPDGSVPLKKYADVIRRIKRNLGLTVVVHTGLIDEETACLLAEADIDAALIEIIGSRETTIAVYHLDVGIEAFESSLGALARHGIPTVPHVLVGLHYGRLRGERRAIDLIAEFDPAALIIIALIPVPGTGMSNVTPPRPEEIAEIITYARKRVPSAPIALGCARPKGEHRKKTDELAILAGVNGIAFPSLRALELARELDLETSFSDTCCALIYRDVGLSH